VPGIFAAQAVKEYVVAVVNATRKHPAVALGASPRGSLALLRLAQARAALAGRHYVIPDDVKELSPAVLAHRLILREGTAAQSADLRVIEEVLEQVPAPPGVETR
jgi:MoxR-like ATPase